MAGMLPGVELARRRRTNHHSSSRCPREPSFHNHHQRRLEPSKAMGETALNARRKLEETLGLTSPRYVKPSNGDTVAKNGLLTGNKLQKTWSPKRNWRKLESVVRLDYFKGEKPMIKPPCCH